MAEFEIQIFPGCKIILPGPTETHSSPISSIKREMLPRVSISYDNHHKIHILDELGFTYVAIMKWRELIPGQKHTTSILLLYIYKPGDWQTSLVASRERGHLIARVSDC